MAELFQEEGYQVASAYNGNEALMLLRSTATLPDVILLDLMMPGMDGYQFRAEQQRDARLCDIPVLLMTAGGDIESKAAAMGARGYLRKPFKDIDTLLTTVQQF